MKILISKNITFDMFCKNNTSILKNTKNGIIEVTKNNTPIFYAITPETLQEIFNIKFSLSHDKKHQKKFPMHSQWAPDQDFLRRAIMWGIILKKEVSKSELACFISYWKAEGCYFYHIQWEQKLARSLERSRSMNYFIQKKRDITHIPTPDKIIPSGFRGQ